MADFKPEERGLVWRETCWTLSMLFLRRERTKEEKVAWRVRKAKIVKGGTRVVWLLVVIDVALLGMWIMGRRGPASISQQVPRHLNDGEGSTEQYTIEVHEEDEAHYESEAEQSCPSTDTTCQDVQGVGDSCHRENDNADHEACGSVREVQSERSSLWSRRRKRLTGTCKVKNTPHSGIPRDERSLYMMEQVYKPTDADSAFRQRPCSTRGCRWLQSYLTDEPAVREAARKNAPCHDFYHHVCEARSITPYQLGAKKLMEGMRRLISREKLTENNLPAGHVSLFKRCLEGKDLLIKDHIRYDWEEKKLDGGCPFRMPKLPLTLANRFFKAGRRRTMPEFFDHIKSLTNNLSLDDSTHPAKGYFAREWVPGACQWISRAARCHYALDLQMPSGEHLERYQLYWKVMYFSPLLGPMANRIFEAVFKEPPKARVQACFSLLEDQYFLNATKLARRALKEAVHRPHDALSRVSWLLRWALRDRAPRWLSRRNRTCRTKALEAGAKAAGGASEAALAGFAKTEEFNLSVAMAVRRHMEVVDAEFLHSHRRIDTPDVSLFTAEAHYVKKRKAVVVSPGLVALMMNATHSSDPMVTTLVGAPILRTMLPRRKGMYSWRWTSQRRLTGVTSCVQNKGHYKKEYAERVVTETAVLEPLFDAYRRSLADEVGLGKRLTREYSNNELFYVLWALGHCGEPQGDVIVNAAVNNSAHFANTFGCSRGDRLWSEDKCTFWH
ncbi:uncharacterized protein LOC144104988 isoform X2 [Amblyomma americanum]